MQLASKFRTGSKLVFLASVGLLAGLALVPLPASAVWNGASTGDGYAVGNTYDYNQTTNWVGSTIDDSLAGFILTGNLTLSLDANRTTVATGLNLTYSGAYNLSLLSDSATTRTLTLGGNVVADALDGDQTITIGSASRPVTVSTGSARSVVVGAGDTLLIDGVFAGNSVINKFGPGTLTLSGSTNNDFNTFAVNEGKLFLAKSANQAMDSALTINQTGVVQYTGDSSDMIGTVGVTINQSGQLDFNGKTDTIGSLTINSTSATGDTTPIANSGTGGTLTIGTLGITPLTGYNTTINTGTGTLTLGGTVTFNAAGSGTAQISGKLDLGTATRNFNVNTGGIGAYGDALEDVVIDAAISGAAGVGLTTGGSTGRLVLSGSNAYTGPTSVSVGVLNICHDTALGTAAAGTTVANNAALELQGGISVGAETLSLNGGGAINGGALRNVSGNNSWGGAVTLAAGSRINSDSGTLTIASGNSMTGAYGLTVGGAGDVTINDAIATGAGTLTKDGAGTLTLAGANSYSGYTSLGGGTLKLDYTTQDNTKLSDTTTLTIGKSTVELAGGSHAELVSGTTLNPGASRVIRSSGTSTLQMNTITRNRGGTIDFAADSLATTDTLNTNGILGGWATVGGTTWASNSTNAADGPITAYTGYTVNTATSLGATTANSDMSGAMDTNVAATTSINSIRFNNAAARTITIASGQQLTVSSGGILETADVGANDNLITGGTLTTGGLVGLTVIQNNPSGTLTINSLVTGNGLTKSGPGKLVLGGDDTNTLIQAAYVNGGTVELNKSGTNVAIPHDLFINQTGVVKYTGDSSNMIADNRAVTIYESGQLDFNGKTDTIATLSIYSTGASGNTTPIANSGTGGTLTIGTLGITPLTGYNTLIDTGTGTFTLGGNVTFNAAGSGTAQISGNLDLGGTTRLFTVNDGDALADVVIDAAISGATGVGLTTGSSGRLVLSGNNTYTGVTSVTQGVVNIRHNNALGTTDAGTTVGSTKTLELQGGISVGAETLSLNGNGVNGIGALRNVSGNNSWGGAITLAANYTRINSDSGTLTIGSTIDGNYSLYIGGAGNVTINDAIATTTLTKDGAGTLTLAGANTYTGATSVTAGGLLVTGTITGSTTTVSSGALIGGSGTTAALTVRGDGDLSPGDNSPDQFSVSGNLLLETGANYIVEVVTGDQPGDGSIGYDQVVVTGTVGLTGANLVLDTTWLTDLTVGQQLTIIDNDASDAVVGLFASLTEGAQVLVEGVPYFTISYKGTTGTDNDVVLTSLINYTTIPEPASLAMLALAAAGIVARRRK